MRGNAGSLDDPLIAFVRSRYGDPDSPATTRIVKRMLADPGARASWELIRRLAHQHPLFESGPQP